MHALIESGMSIQDVAATAGLKKIDVMRFCAEHGLMPKATIKHSGLPKQRTARQVVADPRLLAMVAEGRTARQIAIELGISHQAVYQRLRKMGVSIQRKQKKQLMSKRYRMPMDMVWHLRSIGATAAYTRQRQNAATRGIGWELTFAQWWEIWEASGKWGMRGRELGGWVMGRHGDVGPYAVGNVVICSHSDNARERETVRLQKRGDFVLDTPKPTVLTSLIRSALA